MGEGNICMDSPNEYSAKDENREVSMRMYERC